MRIRDARRALMLLIDLIWGFAAAAVFVHVFSTERAGPSLVAVAAVVLGTTAVGALTRTLEDSAGRLPIAAAAFSLVALFIIAESEYADAPWDVAWVRSLPTRGASINDADRGVIGGVIVLTFLWLRGTGVAARADDASSALGSVLFGLAAVALAATVSPPARGPDLFGVLALIYVPLALIALSMYQVADPDRSLRETVAQSGRWLAAMVAVTIGVAVVASAIDPRSLGALAPVGRPLLSAVVIGATFLLAPIFALLAAIIHIFPSLPHHHLPPQPVVQPPQGLQRLNGTPEWQIIVGRVLAGIGIVVVVAGLLALIWLALRRRTPRKRDAHERRETIEDEQDVADEAGDLLGGLLRRFRRQQPAVTRSVAVRRLYHEMLADAAAAGIERRLSTTPLQFAPRLDVHYASDTPSAISGAFTQSRYGRAELDDATVTELRRRWLAARSARAGPP